MQNQIPYIITPTNISLQVGAKLTVVPNTHPNFEQIREKLRTGDHSNIENLMDIPEAVTRWSDGRVKVTDGEVFYQDMPVQNVLTNRILQMMQDGFDIAPMCRFLENMMENPDYSVVQHARLYQFLEKNHRPITEDGCFLADKGVNQEGYDQWTGKIRNHVGDVVEMPRNQVNNDHNQACSYGLHVGNYDYVKGFGIRKMLVKVNPRDVVALPYDDASKMRVCRYEVIGEMQADHYFERDETHRSVMQYGSGNYCLDLIGLEEDGDVVRQEYDDYFHSLEDAVEELKAQFAEDYPDVDKATIKVTNVSFSEEEDFDDEDDNWIN